MTGGQESAHSHPPALAAATTGLGTGCATQVPPAFPVASSLPVSETTQVRAPSTAATCSGVSDCCVAGISVPLVTQSLPPSRVVASRTGWAWKYTFVPRPSPSGTSHSTCGAVSATPTSADTNRIAPSRHA